MLGAPDAPTDGVADYCTLLGRALEARGHRVRLLRADWQRDGWRRALSSLRREIAVDQPDCLVMQYTHLMWARHGFPYMAMRVARLVKRLGVNLAIVIHDPLPFSGPRFRDHCRHYSQVLVMRVLGRLADSVVVTIPPAGIPWLRGGFGPSATCIPVGPNIEPIRSTHRRLGGRFTVAVFGVTEGNSEEVKRIALALRLAAKQLQECRLIVLGRGAIEAESLLRQLLDGCSVDLITVGIAPAHEIAAWLDKSNVMLFIRGGVSSRRTTAIAALAHGLPIVGWEGPETVGCITEAGLLLGIPGDTDGLARSLVRIATEPGLGDELCRRSRVAYETHFTWDRIAQQFEDVVCHR